MSRLLARIGSKIPRLVLKLLAWRWNKSRNAWQCAWNENKNTRIIRIVYLVIGTFVAYLLTQLTFSELGVIGGISYLVALLGTIANATVFKIVKVGRVNYIPLGTVAPFATLVGVIGSRAIRPLLGDVKEAAFAQDFLGALIILAIFVILTLWFRRWQSGSPPIQLQAPRGRGRKLS